MKEIYKEVHPRTWKNARLELLNSNRYKRVTHTVDIMAGVKALEKQIPEKPHLWGDGYGTDGNLVLDMWACPNCHESYEVEYHNYKYCPNCGQHLDWRDTE